MWRAVTAAAFAFAATAGMAAAQEERPSNRYMGCRSADGVDARLQEICETIDLIHRRLHDVRGQPYRTAEIQYAHSQALLAIGDLGDELALRNCIEAARVSQTYFGLRRFPTRWAGMQLTIGQAMTALGARGDAALREEAPQVLLAGIEAIDRAAQPQLWASSQVAFADAYLVQGEGDPVSVQRAIAALQASLEIYRRPAFAERRVRIEARIAELYAALGQEPDPA
jgi:hypothetical protein